MDSAARWIDQVTRKAEFIANEYTGNTVQAVHIACEKESGSFWNISIPSNHPVFDGPLLEVPAKTHIPLVIHRIGTKSKHRADLECPIATCLNIKYTNGVAPQKWQSGVGSCIVARKTKGP
jgi:hypothetical protein